MLAVGTDADTNDTVSSIRRRARSSTLGNTVRRATRRAVATATSGDAIITSSNTAEGIRATRQSRTTTAVRDRPSPVSNAPSPNTATGSASHGINGIGRMAVDSVNRGDQPRIVGVMLVASFFVVLANIQVDLSYALLDSRVRIA